MGFQRMMNASAPGRPVAFVTGAAGGIGQAVCHRLLETGHFVIVADKDGARAAAVARELGSAALGVETDVADQDSVGAAFDRAESAFGTVTKLVNNAGYASQVPFTEMVPSDWEDEFRVMLSGAIHTVRRALPGMRELGGGAVVNVASVNGMAFYSHPTYSATKSALISLSQSLAALFGGSGVRINVVSPGTVVTPIWGPDAIAIADRVAPLVPYVPLGKMASPRDIAEAVAFLLSDEAGHITGANLPVDGGLTTGILPMATYISGDH